MSRRVTVVALSLAVSTPLQILGAQAAEQDSARAAALAAPLFATHDVLSFTIEAPLGSILDERSQESTEYPGHAVVQQPDGQSARVNVAIRTRGKSRLDRRICRFPPLRLNFAKRSARGTVFEGQDKIKLVTHCQDRDEYEQYAVQEYLLYRVLNLLTDMSFRVRLARITYVDTERDAAPLTRYGFLIEPDELLAARHGLEALEAPGVPPELVIPHQLSLVEVFQYLIGNTDWSAFARERDRPNCCHNMLPVGTDDGLVYPVPYDFDLAGAINARYANALYKPREKGLDIRSVRARLYRGWCDSEPYLPAVFVKFNEAKDAIYALYRMQEQLDPTALRETLEYFDAFFQTINNPGRVSREFRSRCRRF